MSEAIYAKPDMRKWKFTKGKMEERMVDIYVNADKQRDGDTRTTTHETEDTAVDNGPGDQSSEPDSSMKRFRVSAVCLEQLCLNGWRYFGSSFYFISTEKKTWEESRLDCQSRGADLVIINSEQEQRFLFNLKMEAWIGLTDKDEEGTWKWVDGTVLTRGTCNQERKKSKEHPSNLVLGRTRSMKTLITPYTETHFQIQDVGVHCSVLNEQNHKEE
ncbi:hypothetical protein UPYG_G00272040 [Umbra pygmaea]|uniref:C-type lectin domain-containing protein n=1 Tax=Umbra pygmaea TaxID=75934 RepID=A0ABD0WT94_UMBPY